MPQTLGDINVQLGADLGALRRGAQNATRILDAYGNTVSTVERRMPQLAAASEKAGQATTELAQGARKASQSLERAGQTVRQTQSAMARTSKTTRGANQVLFTLGDASQDAAYNLRFAGNNVAFLAEQFSNVSDRAGGFKAGLKAVGASLFGVGGIILGIQLLISYGPKLINFFKGTSAAAEEAAKAYKEAMDAATEAVLRLDSGLGEVVVTSATLPGVLANVQSALAATTLNLKDAREELGRLETKLDAIEAVETRGLGAEALKLLRERRKELKSQIGQQQRIIDQIEKRQVREESALSQLKEFRKELDAQIGVTNVLLRAGAERAQNAKDLAEQASVVRENYDELASTMRGLKASVEIGLRTPLEASLARVGALQQAFVSLAQEGISTSSAAAQRLVEQIGEANERVIELTENMDVTLPDLSEDLKKLEDIDITEDLEDFGKELEKALEGPQTFAEEFRESMISTRDIGIRALHDISRATGFLASDLIGLDNRINTIEEAFEQFGRAAVQALQNVVASLVQVGVEMLALRAIGGLAGLLGGGGLGNLLGRLGGALGVGGGAAFQTIDMDLPGRLGPSPVAGPGMPALPPQGGFFSRADASALAAEVQAVQAEVRTLNQNLLAVAERPAQLQLQRRTSRRIVDQAQEYTVTKSGRR